MKFFLRILIIWTTLLAVPIQASAFATMPFCAAHHAAAMAPDHDADSLHSGDAAEHGHSVASRGGSIHHVQAQHGAGKCATCMTCTACMAMAPSGIDIPSLPSETDGVAPVEPQPPSSVDLALPKRPPRA